MGGQESDALTLPLGEFWEVGILPDLVLPFLLFRGATGMPFFVTLVLERVQPAEIYFPDDL
jgi:hypothetical protein